MKIWFNCADTEKLQQNKYLRRINVGIVFKNTYRNSSCLDCIHPVCFFGTTLKNIPHIHSKIFDNTAERVNPFRQENERTTRKVNWTLIPNKQEKILYTYATLLAHGPYIALYDDNDISPL